jgi:hypothetical protein
MQTARLLTTSQKTILPPCLPVHFIYILNMQAVCFSETCETTCHITWCQNTEDNNTKAESKLFEQTGLIFVTEVQ